MTTSPLQQFFLKTKIGSDGDEATDLHAIKILEAGYNYICWSVIFINSVLNIDENYYPQVFLKKFKYIEKDKNVIRHITDDFKNLF